MHDVFIALVVIAVAVALMSAIIAFTLYDPTIARAVRNPVPSSVPQLDVRAFA